MKHISFWASRHIWSTRLLIVLIYILLNVVGWAAGDLLNASGIELNYAFILLCIALTMVGLFIYPTHNKKISFKKRYRIHKTADILLASATFLFIVYSGNRLSSAVPGNQAKGADVSVQSYKISSEPEKLSTKVSLPDHKKKKKSFREWRKKMKAALSEIRKAYRQDKNGKRITLVTLSIVIAVILTLLLAALSCEIACSGAEALAIIVFISGLAGIIFGLVGVIKSINRKYKKLKTDKEPATTQT